MQIKWSLVVLAAFACVACEGGRGNAELSSRADMVVGEVQLPACDQAQWVGAWSASPVIAGPAAFGFATESFSNQSFRAIVHPHFHGEAIRIRISNRFGVQSLEIGAATVGVSAGGAAVVPGSNTPILFGGQPGVQIPRGGAALSDPVPFDVVLYQNLAVSLHIASTDLAPTNHSEAHQTSYVSSTGDHTLDESGAAFSRTATSWYYLSAVDVKASRPVNAVLPFGDSITDGSGSTLDANNRYPDFLSRRLMALPQTQQMSVLNAGIGGNQVLADGLGGVSALTRLDSDALALTGVTDVIVLEGINDINFSQATGAELIAGHQQIVARLRAKGLRVHGATLTPNGAKPARDELNHWIRTSGVYDSVVDFAAAIADPADPDAILPAYDSGDGLHPSDAGYEAMANSVDLQALTGSPCREM